MATYKLIQDIEAEDKLFWQFTLRQFIYGLIAAFLGYIIFILVSKHAAFLAVFFLPPALFCAFFAIPFGKDQSTEVWALAKIRFYLKPRRRIWDQSGMKELVTITVPKKIERVLTNGLGEAEVRSRLQALANTIDSRGWAVKNVSVNMYGQANPLMEEQTDRLVDVNSMPQDVPPVDVQASDDMLDATSNPVAQQFDQMIKKSEEEHRQQIVDQMNRQTAAQNAAPASAGNHSLPADYWFLNQNNGPSKTPPGEVAFGQKVVLPGAEDNAPEPEATDAEQKFLKSHVQSRQSLQSSPHLRTLQTLDEQAAAVATPPTPSPVTSDPAILSLASNDDLNVATIERVAKKASDKPQDDEVVISLH